ncbi:carbohydrate ABC transporter permease [Fodinicola acaciae]|uniref:carbohydrate ABC transporter permease n=1 Tax=Fodinicola acaciae TaxID=2681555 RepID=UPI0013D54F76|nr:sugar ABC transporter permease [Fodinicola acaciae]
MATESATVASVRQQHAIVPLSRRKWWRRRRRDIGAGYAFIAPAIIGFTVLVAYPIVFSAYHAFTDWNGLTPAVWSGWHNFQYLFTQDPTFWPSIKATAIYTLLAVPSTLLVGLGLAVLLNRALAGARWFRTIFFLPVVLPAVAVLTLWKYLYDPQYGLANQLLTALHLPTSLWLGSTRMALPSIVIIGLWGCGATMMIFLAGLQTVPAELHEAARIDGAGPIRSFCHVTMPMLTPILLLQVVLQINQAFQAFTQVQLLTNGGPDNTTNMLMYKIYADGFQNFSKFPQLGYATAEVWILFMLILVVTALTVRTSSLWVYADNTRD